MAIDHIKAFGAGALSLATIGGLLFVMIFFLAIAPLREQVSDEAARSDQVAADLVEIRLELSDSQERLAFLEYVANYLRSELVDGGTGTGY